MKVRTYRVNGSIYFKGDEIGVFTIDGDEVIYLINCKVHTMTFNGFETMCEALEYDLKVK